MHVIHVSPVPNEYINEYAKNVKTTSKEIDHRLKKKKNLTSTKKRQQYNKGSSIHVIHVCPVPNEYINQYAKI